MRRDRRKQAKEIKVEDDWQKNHVVELKSTLRQEMTVCDVDS